MSPDGKNWTITLRKSIQFNDNWGEFTAKDVRHAVFLLSQSESVQTDAGTWRTWMGITKTVATVGDSMPARTIKRGCARDGRGCRGCALSSSAVCVRLAGCKSSIFLLT
jgi:hypothetical protein